MQIQISCLTEESIPFKKEISYWTYERSASSLHRCFPTLKKLKSVMTDFAFLVCGTYFSSLDEPKNQYLFDDPENQSNRQFSEHPFFTWRKMRIFCEGSFQKVV